MKKSICLTLILLSLFAIAHAASDAYKLNQAILTQWKQSIPERPVREVVIHLKRAEGNENTFVNLRFGREGNTLDGSKRVYLKDTNWQKVKWNVGNQAPNGQPLILNVYNGKVSVDYVHVIWQ